MRAAVSYLVLLAVLVAAGTTSSAARLPRVHANADNIFLQDDSGRIRFFHGLNFVQKSFPWYPTHLLNVTRVAQLADLGINVVRLGYMWTGAQPTPDGFNTTYIDTIETIVNILADHGIFTLLDVHQDAFSSKFCLYDGVPLWVANKSVPRHAFPWPMTGDCDSRQWGANELTEACSQAYGDLYHNIHGMRDDFVAFWRESARRFANLSVLGYEIINEPFAGDIYADPSLLLPGEAGSKDLTLLYDTVAPAIRAEDDTTLIFYEPVVWGMVLNGNVTGTGFTHVPGGSAYRNRSVLSFHYYCWFYGDNPTNLTRIVCDDALGPEVFHSVSKDVSQIGGSAFLTEFGAGTCNIDSGTGRECNAVMDECDRHFMSWIHWPGDDSGGGGYNLTRYVDDGYARPFAQAVAGVPSHMELDTQDPVTPFTLCWQPTAELLSLSTDIYASASYYPGGPVVKASPHLTVAMGRNTVLHVTANSTAAACVTLFRKE